MKTLKNVLLSTLMLTLFFACKNSESDSISMEDPTISIRLVDNPGDFDEVNIDVVDVMIKMNDDSDDDNGWQTLDPINTGVYNLLDLTGGINVLLVDKFQIPAGTLSQIRLVLGTDNTVVMNGETFPLKTPSAQQSGLKLKVNATLEEGYTYDFLLDFDVDKSIVVAGNSGNINLKPVMRVSAEVSSGIIEGTVDPADVSTMAYVVVDDKGTPETDDDDIISAYTDDTGHFALWGVPAGTYDVILAPDVDSKYAETTVEGVTVVNGETTVIDGVISLALKMGNINGKVTNAGITATASVMVDGSEVTANTNAEGVFLLEDIPVGTYTVTITPSAGDAIIKNDVVVEEDMTTDLGDITFP